MPVVSVFSVSPSIRQQIKELILNLDRGQPDTLRVDCCDAFFDFLSSANNTPRRILMLAQEGTMSVDMAAEVRERFPDHCFVWFSDLDYALFAYRLDADYISLLPVTEGKLRTALRNCMCHVCHHTTVQTKPAEKPVVRSKLLTILGRITKVIQFCDFF